jgi:hypothetical protein
MSLRRSARSSRQVNPEEGAAAPPAAAEQAAAGGGGMSQAPSAPPAPGAAAGGGGGMAPPAPAAPGVAGGGIAQVPPGGLAAAAPTQPTLLQLLQTPGITESTFRYTPIPTIDATALGGDAAAQTYLTFSYNFQRALYDCLQQYLIYQDIYRIEGRVSATPGRNVFAVPKSAAATKVAGCNFIATYFILTYLATQKLASYESLPGPLKTSVSLTRQSSGMATVGSFSLAPIIRLTDRELVGLNAVASMIYGDSDYNDCIGAVKGVMPAIPSGGWPAINAGAAALFEALNTERGGRYTLAVPPESRQTVPEWAAGVAAGVPAVASRLFTSVRPPLAAAAGFAGQAAEAVLSGQSAYTQRRNILPGGAVPVFPIAPSMNYVYVDGEEMSKSALVVRIRAAVERFKETNRFGEMSKEKKAKLLAQLQAFKNIFQHSTSPNAGMIHTVVEMIRQLSPLPAGAGEYGRNQGGGARRTRRRHRNRNQKKHRATRARRR